MIKCKCLNRCIVNDLYINRRNTNHIKFNELMQKRVSAENDFVDFLLYHRTATGISVWETMFEDNIICRGNDFLGQPQESYIHYYDNLCLKSIFDMDITLFPGIKRLLHDHAGSEIACLTLDEILSDYQFTYSIHGKDQMVVKKIDNKVIFECNNNIIALVEDATSPSMAKQLDSWDINTVSQISIQKNFLEYTPYISFFRQIIFI